MLRAEKDDQLFPDEVDTPLNMLAKTRFARLVNKIVQKYTVIFYRGTKFEFFMYYLQV